MTQSDTSEKVRSIAQETDMPPETVAKMYEETMRELAEGARVMDYVPLFTAKRVRAALRSTPGRNGSVEASA